MNKRKYQWPIYETWIVTSKPSWSFNFILGYKEVVFTLEFLRQNAHCYAKKCYASGKQLTPVLFRKHGRVYILMARTKTKTCHKAEGRASTNPSLASLSRGVGGGEGAYLWQWQWQFISSTFEEGWGSMKLVIICIRRSKSNPNSRRLTILDQSTLA